MVHIITDTTACFPDIIVDRYHIPVIPQIITFGEESYYEGVEITTAMFMQRLSSSALLPKTAAPPPELFAQEFRRLAPTGEPILCIHPSSDVSGTVRSATVAAQDFPGVDIRVIDTRTVASPLGTMVILAARWAEAGDDIDSIVTRLESLIRRCRVYFLVSTLEFLARGGRIGGASALVGSVLQIKPILTLTNGRVEVYERQRTHHRAMVRMREIVAKQAPREGHAYLSVMHADALGEAQSLAAELAGMLDQQDVPITHVPPAVVTHGGPGILGVGFFVAENSTDLL